MMFLFFSILRIFFPLGCSSLADNARRLGEVAASTTLPTRATAAKIYKYCPREIMPPSCQTDTLEAGESQRSAFSVYRVNFNTITHFLMWCCVSGCGLTLSSGKSEVPLRAVGVCWENTTFPTYILYGSPKNGQFRFLCPRSHPTNLRAGAFFAEKRQKM
jgi:hypothetical protein